MTKKVHTKTAQPAKRFAGRRHFIVFAFLGIGIFLAYSNSLTGTWALDDIVANKPVGMKDIRDLAGFRTVAGLTFMLNQHIAPFSPASFRLVNILIHLLNTALVYVLAYKTMGLLVMKSEKSAALRKRKDSDTLRSTDNRAFYTALLSSVIFGFHPININAVAYIVQRMASLATFFVLLSLLCCVIAFTSGNRARKVILYVLSGIMLIAGILSKENAVMAVPLILLYDYIFLSRFNHRVFLRKSIIAAGIGVLCITIVSFFLGFHTMFVTVATFLLNPAEPLQEKIWMAIDVYWTPLQHILTEFRVVARYLFLVFAPLPQFLVFDWWGFPVSKGLTEPVTTLFSAALLSSLLIFAIAKVRRFPMLCFGILWYFIAISLESFFSLGADLYFEHRNYLPLSGLLIGIVGQSVLSLGDKMTVKTAWAAALILCTALGSLTFTRNFVWKDSVTLWGDTLKKNPANIRALLSMGNAYVKLSDFENAERFYKEAVEISARDRRASFLNGSVYRLGMSYLLEKDLEKARDLIGAMEESIDSYNLKILKGFYMASTDKTDEAIKLYNDVLPAAKGIDRVVVSVLIGDAYREKGQWDDAIEHYNRALFLDPSFSAAYYGIGVSYMAKLDSDRAYHYFNKTLSLDPDNVLALSDMADLMLINKTDIHGALGYAQKAVSMPSPFYQPYLTMANVLIVLGRDKEAEDFYQRALDHKMHDYMVPFSKARAYYLKGDMEKTRYYLSELQRYKNLPEKVKGILHEKGGKTLR